MCSSVTCFFLHDTPTTEIYTYLHTPSLHDALPISSNFRLIGSAVIAFQKSRSSCNSIVTELPEASVIAFQKSRSSCNPSSGWRCCPMVIAFQKSRSSCNLPYLGALQTVVITFQKLRSSYNPIRHKLTPTNKEKYCKATRVHVSIVSID